MKETKWTLEISRAAMPPVGDWTAKILEHGRSVEVELPEVLPDFIGTYHAAVFIAVLEAKLSVEVELGNPSVADVLSRTLEVIGVTPMDHLEEHCFHQTKQRAEENFLTMLDEWARSEHSL